MAARTIDQITSLHNFKSQLREVLRKQTKTGKGCPWPEQCKGALRWLGCELRMNTSLIKYGKEKRKKNLVGRKQLVSWPREGTKAFTESFSSWSKNNRRKLIVRLGGHTRFWDALSPTVKCLIYLFIVRRSIGNC